MKKLILDELGIPVVEHCNINCKGCLHFCHKGQKPHFYQLNNYYSDLEQLKKFVEDIKVIRLYGGEPLLHPELEEFILVSREVFPNADIELLTNGLLITSMPQKLLQTLKESCTAIKWSVYPIISNEKFQKICTFLKKNGLRYTANRVEQFYTCYNFNGDSSKKTMFKKCSGKYCHLMRNGKFSVCPVPLVGHLINEFGVTFDFSDSILDLYSENMTSERINDFLNSAHDICRYCSPPKYFNWELQKVPALNDWITKN